MVGPGLDPSETTDEALGGRRARRYRPEHADVDRRSRLRALPERDQRAERAPERAPRASGNPACCRIPAASFLGGQAIRAGDISVLGGFAVAAYLLCIAGCIKVLLPHRLVFSFRGSTLIEVARQAQADLDETLEVATGWFETFLEDNRIELEKLTRWYTLSCLALGGEIVLWLLGAPDILG